MTIAEASGSIAQTQSIQKKFSSTAFNKLRTGRIWGSSDMFSIAHGINYLNFHGNQVISSHVVDSTVSHLMSTTTTYAITPNPNITERTWVIKGYGLQPGILTIQAGGSPVLSYSMDKVRESLLYVEQIVAPNSQSQVEFVDLNLSYSGSATGGNFRWQNTACFELPRKLISPEIDTDEPGILTNSFKRGYNIFNAGSEQNQSIGALARGISHAKENTRRACLYQKSTIVSTGSYGDISGSGSTRNYSENVVQSWGKTNIYNLNAAGSAFDFRIPITPRKKFKTNFDRAPVGIYVQAMLDTPNTTGSMYFTNQSGQSVTMSINADVDVPVWVSASLPFRYESFQTFNNRPALGQDNCLVEAEVTNGPGTNLLMIKTIAFVEEEEPIPSWIVATGGTIVTQSIGGTDYAIHTFTTTGANTFTVDSIDTHDREVEYLIVGGGGSGGNAGGGGGAGGVVSGSTVVTDIAYAVTVGAGAVGVNDSSARDTGGYSYFTTIAYGGGSGGNYAVGPANGTSGGGGCSISTIGGTGTTGQGNDGGKGTYDALTINQKGGGGGGFGGIGGNPSREGGAGGIGVSSNITGPTTWYAGGGGGWSGLTGTIVGIGGQGGGGDGSTGVGAFFGEDGDPNTGGGGGADAAGSGGAGGSGGSGIVIIRYPISY